MNITIPVYIQEIKTDQSAPPLYTVRPLFFEAPVERDEVLKRAINKLARSLRRYFDYFGKQPKQNSLAAYTFCPEIEEHLYEFSLSLKHRRAGCRLLVVAFEALGRKVAFSPTLPQLWFDVGRGETLFDRATEVLTRHFRDLEKEDPQNAIKPEGISLPGKAWLTTLELDIQLRLEVEKKEEQLLAAIGGSAVLDGEDELNSVGRCFNFLYPDELDRVINREQEVAELTRLLNAADKRPILIIGPRLAGKTAIIHEYVYRSVEKRRTTYSSKNNLWLLSPQRLISGMSYVGQWENRLLAILKEAKAKDHILYFDDLLGLFHAGVTRDSRLCALDVLKPYVEKREFRMLAEITPEAFRVLQEKDRGFADMFQILRVREMNEDETLQVLISLMRQLERQHQCRFELDVLPVVLDIERRYVRDAAFPGKAAAFLRQLAVKYRNLSVTRKNVFEEFHAKSGLSITFLDRGAKLDRDEVTGALGREVIGQATALRAAADVVSTSKARLNDPDRPLASFLFLGPTGVGKTQCAKSLAGYLFGDPDKILRFDMNEFVSPQSVSRLVGTFSNPEGLLTSAVRRQPFSVVLLDEIEKAEPDVFNLLLQVMGDGRLTDALGRTVDFTNTILIMTSNLGVKEAGGNLGFRQGETDDSHIYIRSAEKFFRPEFFNRLDQIIPFQRLLREDVQRIAVRLIQDVFAREGLMRRKCILQIDDRAMEKIVDQGYHPLLGARALKRAIERQLTQPVASRLTSMRIDTPTIISLHPSGDSIAVHVQALTQIEPEEYPPTSLDHKDPKTVLEQIETTVSHIEDETAHLRPVGAIDTERIAPEHYRYFVIKEQARRIDSICRRIAGRLSGAKRSSTIVSKFSARGKPRFPIAKQIGFRGANRRTLMDLLAKHDIHYSLQELAAGVMAQEEQIEDQLAEALRETALLKALAATDESSTTTEVLVYIRSMDESRKPQRVALATLYEKLFSNQWGLEVEAIKNCDESLRRNAEVILIKGAHALRILRLEEGTHLFFPPHDNFVPIQVMVLPIAEDEEAVSVLRSHVNKRKRWLEQLLKGEETADGDPFHLLPVIRIYDEQGATLDLRTGLMSQKMPTVGEMRAFILTALVF